MHIKSNHAILVGPHEEALIEKKKTRADWGQNIALANDHVILAVAQVWDKCKKILASRGMNNGQE